MELAKVNTKITYEIREAIIDCLVQSDESGLLDKSFGFKKIATMVMEKFEYACKPDIEEAERMYRSKYGVFRRRFNPKLLPRLVDDVSSILGIEDRDEESRKNIVFYTVYQAMVAVCE